MARHARGSPFGSNGDDRRQWRKQGGAVGAAASRMRAAAKQTLGAATRAVAPKVTERASPPARCGTCRGAFRTKRRDAEALRLGGWLVDKFVVVCAAHGEGGRAAAVGEGEEGVLRAQRQHGIDVQRRLTALRTEDEGIYALLFQF